MLFSAHAVPDSTTIIELGVVLSAKILPEAKLRTTPCFECFGVHDKYDL